MAIQVDVRVSAEALIRSTGERWSGIVTELVRENALLSASLEQVTARASELEAQLTALTEDAPKPEPAE